MVLIIDNYDSFSYNLYQAVGTFTDDIKIIKNDELTVAEIEALNPSHIILSPGPKRPKDAGVCIEVVQKLHTKFPILGVCLGHQSICEAFGATVSYAKIIMHGKQSLIAIEESELFDTLPQEFLVARYHSLAALKDTMPDCLRITAKTEDGEIMAVQHEKYPVFGVQFHPESILTPNGITIIKNFLKIHGEKK